MSGPAAQREITKAFAAISIVDKAFGGELKPGPGQPAQGGKESHQMTEEERKKRERAEKGKGKAVAS